MRWSHSDGLGECAEELLLQLRVWYRFSGCECGALFGSRYKWTGRRGRAWPPKDLVGIFLLTLAEVAYDVGEMEGEWCVRDGTACKG